MNVSEMTGKGRHLTEDQRNAIIARKRDGVSTLAAAKELSIPHRTVQFWYKRANDTPTEGTTLKGQYLFCLQELGRLLCWPAPKLAECLQPYIPKLHRGSLKLKGARPNKRQKALVSDRTVQRYLEKCGVMTNVRKVWADGSVAAHAVRITWWEHDFTDKRIQAVGKRSKKITGWLLLVGERGLVNAKDTRARELAVRIALLPGERLDSDKAMQIISAAINKHYSGAMTMHLVSDENGRPTAVEGVESLREVLQGVDVVVDKPTGVKGAIEVGASFPSPRSVESYLAIIRALKSGTPKFSSSAWREIHSNIMDDDFVAEKTGVFLPFLRR